ncbi:uncharacterized protein LOC144706612 isoform X2 [Wolffia australiana]
MHCKRGIWAGPRSPNPPPSGAVGLRLGFRGRSASSLAMAPARVGKRPPREEDHVDVVFCISSDDEEANVDLSARIVAMSRDRDARKPDPSCENLILVDESPEKTKRRKKKKQKTSPPVESVGFQAQEDLSDNIVFRKLLRGPRYFEPGSARVETCYNCFEEGHTAADCTSAKRLKPCFVCGMFGHNAYKCLQGQDCFICKKRGHMAKDCPKKHKTDNLDIQICMRCGDVGHDMSSCRKEYPHEDLQKIQCYVCKGFGHFCCALYEDTSPANISCYVCGESGHSGMGCARYWGESSVDKAPKICYICGEEGHLARGCTQISVTSSSKREATFDKQARRSSSSSVKASKMCYLCHEKGHLAHNCPTGTPSSSAKRERRRGEYVHSTPNSVENGRSGGHFGHSNKRKDFSGSKNRTHIAEGSKSWGKYENSRPRGGWIVDDDPRDFDRRSWSMYQRSTYTPRMWNF